MFKIEINGVINDAVIINDREEAIKTADALKGGAYADGDVIVCKVLDDGRTKIVYAAKGRPAVVAAKGRSESKTVRSHRKAQRKPAITNNGGVTEW